MNQFDVIDKVYSAVSHIATTYKIKAPVDASGDFIVLNTVTDQHLQAVNPIPVNVNFYCRKLSNGMVDSARIETVSGLLSAITINDILNYEYSFTNLDTDSDLEYDILNTRLLVRVSANI